MQQLRLFFQITDDLKESQRAHRRELARRLRNLETQPDVTLTRQMVNLIRLRFHHDPANRGGIVEVAVVQEQRMLIDVLVAKQRVQPGAHRVTRPAHESMDDIAFFEQPFGQVRTVLTGDAGD